MRRRAFSQALPVILVVLMGAAFFHAYGSKADLQQARSWWPQLTNVFTPVGWKNHLFRLEPKR